MILSEACGSSESQGLPIPRQLEVTPPGLLLPCPSAHGALPVDGAGARARVELLVLHERLDLQGQGAGLDAHRDRILGSGPARAPAPERLEADLSRLEAAHAPAGAAQSSARPETAAVPGTYAKRHERTAVGEIDSDPVPADRLPGQSLARPFVIEPGFARDLQLPAADDDAARNREMRKAVVVARLRRVRPFAAEAALALEQHRLFRIETEAVAEIARRDLRRVLAPGLLERPVFDRDLGAALLGTGEPEACARGALVVQQPTGRRIGERGMREEQLPRREAAGKVLGDARPVAKKSDLHAEFPAARRLEPAGDVPPFAAELRMAAVVARELQHCALAHRRILTLRVDEDGERGEHQREREPHQSSFTARAASPLIACRPLAIAVNVASTSITATNSAKSCQGRCSSIPQWNEWRFTTWMSTRLITQPSVRPTARPRALTSSPCAASMEPICRRVIPMWRSTPNSRRRASTSAPKLEESPKRPIATATASSA